MGSSPISGISFCHRGLGPISGSFFFCFGWVRSHQWYFLLLSWPVAVRGWLADDRTEHGEDVLARPSKLAPIFIVEHEAQLPVDELPAAPPVLVACCPQNAHWRSRGSSSPTGFAAASTASIRETAAATFLPKARLFEGDAPSVSGSGSSAGGGRVVLRLRMELVVAGSNHGASSEPHAAVELNA